MQILILSCPVNMIYYKYLTNYNVCTQMRRFNMSAHYIKHWHIYQSWHWWESFETKDTKRCILMFLEVEKDEKMLKTRTIDGAFWRNLKRCSCSWNCWEHLKKQGRKIMHSDAIWNDVLELEVHSDAFRRMWSTTFRGAIDILILACTFVFTNMSLCWY